MKLTPWFPGTVNPVHPGVYQRELHTYNIVYSYWDGMRWYIGNQHLPYALESYQQEQTSAYPHCPWRGIMKTEG